MFLPLPEVSHIVMFNLWSVVVALCFYFSCFFVFCFLLCAKDLIMCAFSHLCVSVPNNFQKGGKRIGLWGAVHECTPLHPVILPLPEVSRIVMFNLGSVINLGVMAWGEDGGCQFVLFLHVFLPPVLY